MISINFIHRIPEDETMPNYQKILPGAFLPQEMYFTSHFVMETSGSFQIHKVEIGQQETGSGATENTRDSDCL